MMGAHGALTKGRFYEESVRVPLVVRMAGHVSNGRPHGDTGADDGRLSRRSSKRSAAS